jgi:hypothetical protein
LLRTFAHDICQSYLAIADRVVHITVYRILGVSQDVQTLNKLNCAKRMLPLPAVFKGLYLPSLELDAKHVEYASFSATLAVLINDYESESLDNMYSLIR